MKNRMIWLLAMVMLIPLMGGCFSLSSYRTAKTLPKDVGEMGIAYTATRIAGGGSSIEVPVLGNNGQPELDDNGQPKTKVETQDAVSVFLPNGLAELWFAVGLVEDLEMTFRVALHNGMAEMGVNYRLVGSDHSDIHLSIAPSIGGRFLVLFEGFTAKFPVLFTYDVMDNMNITLGGFVDYNYVSLTDSFGGSSDSSDLFSGNFLNAGATFQLRYQGDTFYVGPIFEYSHTVADFGADKFDISSALDLIFVGITSGWYFGKEKQQLDRMEKKIDNIGDKLEVDEDGDRYNFSWLNQVDEDQSVSVLDPR